MKLRYKLKNIDLEEIYEKLERLYKKLNGENYAI